MLKRKWKQILVVVLLVPVLVVVGGGFLIAHQVVDDMAGSPVAFGEIHASEDHGIESEKMDIRTEDGFDLAVYRVKADDPVGAVIFLSGIHKPSVTAFYGHAAMVRAWGYESYLLEMRAHGASAGEEIGLGFTEVEDVRAVLKVIEADPRFEDLPVVVYGLSMGGTVAINAVGELPGIDGLVSLSAYSSFEDQFVDQMVLMGAPKLFTTFQRPIVKTYTTLRFGRATRHRSPQMAIEHLGDRPALFMHSEGDDQVPVKNLERILEVAPDHVEVFLKEGNHHMILEGEDFFHPENDPVYSERVYRFFKDQFGVGGAL